MIANVWGFGAMCSLFLIYQQRNRKNILYCKLSADLFWIAHYFCLGATAGMIPNFVGAFREIVFINRNTRKWASSPIWVVFFIFLNFFLGVVALDNWYDIVPIIASSFVTISLWIDNPKLTKIISVPVSASFLIYDIFVKSYIGIINESISISSFILYLFKMLKEEKAK